MLKLAVEKGVKTRYEVMPSECTLSRRVHEPSLTMLLLSSSERLRQGPETSERGQAAIPLCAQVSSLIACWSFGQLTKSRPSFRTDI